MGAFVAAIQADAAEAATRQAQALQQQTEDGEKSAEPEDEGKMEEG